MNRFSADRLAGHQSSEPMLEELQHTLKGRMSFFRVGTGILEVMGMGMVVLCELGCQPASVFIVVPRKFGHMLGVLKASNFPSMEALLFFIDPSHLRSSFPWKSELFRVFSEVLMVVFVDTWRRPPVQTFWRLETLQLEDGCHKRKNSV